MKLSEGAAASGIYEFGDFCLDAGKRLVSRRHGPLVPLTPKVFYTLLYLVQHPGMLVEKDRLNGGGLACCDRRRE
jgi:DNA-binding response OmpR family regulator